MEIQVNNIEETYELAKRLSKHLKVGSVILLNGNLGAGKTVFAKALGKAFNVKEDINSPTFNILKCYFSGDLPFYHIDAYRLEDVPDENKNIGLEEVIEGDGICVIEWPEFINELLTGIPTICINIKILSENSRVFEIKSAFSEYKETLKELENEYIIVR